MIDPDRILILTFIQTPFSLSLFFFLPLLQYTNMDRQKTDKMLVGVTQGVLFLVGSSKVMGPSKTFMLVLLVGETIAVTQIIRILMLVPVLLLILLRQLFVINSVQILRMHLSVVVVVMTVPIIMALMLVVKVRTSQLLICVLLERK